MNIVCVICRDLLVPSDDIFNTPCGHIFHYVCLLQWLERSQTCPQCRERATKHKIHRIYFNFSNNDNLVEDPTSLQHKLDNITFQLKLKDNVINNLTESKEKLEKQTRGLREEVKNVESELNSKDAAIRALQTQIKFFKLQCVELDEYKKDYEQLKEKVKNLQNLQVLLEGSESEVNEVIARTPDHTKLVTYIGVLKREMEVSFDKRRKLKLTIRSLEQKLMESNRKCKVLEDERIKRKELETQLNICLSEKMSLQNQLLDKQDNNNKKSIRQEEEINVSNECLRLGDNLKKSSNLEKDDSCIIIEPDNNGDTPQSMKSKGFFSLRDCGNGALKRNYTDLKIPSILMKKSKFSQPNQKTDLENCNGMTFDGFGGHSRVDVFPIPKLDSTGSNLSLYARKIKMDRKMRKSKLDIGDNQKLSDIFLPAGQNRQ